MNSHQLIDQRSLELHRIAAMRMRDDPRLFELACERLRRWFGSASPDLRPQLAEWSRLMDLGMGACLQVAVEESERATALRQSSPLPFVLTHSERFNFLKTWRSKDGARYAAP